MKMSVQVPFGLSISLSIILSPPPVVTNVVLYELLTDTENLFNLF